MNDIVPELLEAIQSQFQEELKSNEKIKEILLKQKKGLIDYTDSLSFAKEIGSILSNAISSNITSEMLPNKRMYFNIAQRILEPTLKENFDIISAQCEKTQNILNQKANIGLKAIKPEYNQEKTQGIINYISNRENYAEVEKSFLEAIRTNAKSVVDDSVKANAEFHQNVGLSPKIIRATNGKTCKWCQSLAGVYNYSDVKKTGNIIFRRHANCDCTVVYDPSDGSNKVQNVWDKKIQYRTNEEEVKKRVDELEKKEKEEEISELRKKLLEKGIEINPVIDYRIQPTEEKIIKDLSGGDMTEGSCMSLAMAYIGNKSGYQVLDFRGGKSCDFFAMNGCPMLSKLEGVNCYIERNFSDYTAVNKLLDNVQEKKEYLLATGGHAAIIRKSKEGFEFLELQSAVKKNNGFKKLDTWQLAYRFNCKKSHRFFKRKIEVPSYLFEAESLYNNDEYKKVMGFINTAFNAQQKGAKGNVK